MTASRPSTLPLRHGNTKHPPQPGAGEPRMGKARTQAVAPHACNHAVSMAPDQAHAAASHWHNMATHTDTDNRNACKTGTRDLGGVRVFSRPPAMATLSPSLESTSTLRLLPDTFVRVVTIRSRP